MAERKIAPLDADFVRWIGEISLEEGAAAARWPGVQKLASQSDPQLIEVLVRLAFSTKAPASGHKDPALSEKLQSFHGAFASVAGYDPAAKREAQVLAACTLARLFRFEAGAPLAVTIASLGGAHVPELPMNLVALAEGAIKVLAKSRRVRPDIASLQIVQTEIGTETEVQAESGVSGKVLEELRQSANDSLEAFADDYNASVEKMATYMRVADEELQMLWWLIGGRSIDLEVELAKVEVSAQPLIFARELADLTAVSPGPIALEAIMTRAGLKTRGKLSIAEAVNAVSQDWATDVTAELAPSPVTSPLHFALDKRIEAGAADAWAKGWSAVTGVAEDFALSPIRLSELFYRERLLLTKG